MKRPRDPDARNAPREVRIALLRDAMEMIDQATGRGHLCSCALDVRDCQDCYVEARLSQASRHIAEVILSLKDVKPREGR